MRTAKLKLPELSAGTIRATALNILNYDLIIGIDPGVTTGFAMSKHKNLLYVGSLKIHDAMFKIQIFKHNKLFVRIEDARKRKWFGKSGREQLQGAGSIKRDCKIWEDFLIDMNIPFEMVAPKQNKTKLDAKKFKMITNWQGKTNEHARDAAMLVFGL